MICETLGRATLLIFLVSGLCAAADFSGTRKLAERTTGSVFHVAPDGDDAATGDSPARAWKTLAHACRAVPAGKHLIRLAAGTFAETECSKPKSGVTIAGNGNMDHKTVIKAPAAWDFTSDKCKNVPEGNVIVIHRQDNVTVRGIEFVNDPGHKANGAVHSSRSSGTVIDGITVRKFRYAGVYLEMGKNLEVANSHFFDSAANFNCDASFLGNITARYITDSKIHHNHITDNRKAYGYRGRSQTNVHIFNNHIRTKSFNMELAHEIDEGVEIYNNDLNGCISIPRGGVNPPKKFPHTIRIHHNLSSAAYGVEGSRNHVRIDHNYFYGEEGNARIYTDYGNNNPGPVWIHHNVAVTCLGFFYSMGKDSNYHIYHNTIIPNERYKGPVFEFYKASGTSNVRFENNLVLARGPRGFANTHGITVPGFTVRNNIFQNIKGVPEGNLTADPRFVMNGAKPFPFYAPARGTPPAKPVRVDLPFPGQRTHIGAYDVAGTEKIGPL